MILRWGNIAHLEQSTDPAGESLVEAAGVELLYTTENR
jgi:hypothetical protein